MEVNQARVTQNRSRLRLRGMRRGTTLAAALALMVAACGVDAGDTTTTAASSTTTTTMVETTTTTTPADTTTTTLAGEPIVFGPVENDILMVVGVAYDDVLNLRAGPGVAQPIIDQIPPTFTNLVAQGNTRYLLNGFWIEVDYEGTLGWVNLTYIAYGGDVSDQTANLIDELGVRPVGSTMTDLGEVVAEAFDSDEEPESKIVQVTEVLEGDLFEVTFDVIGLGDDSILGLRLHVFAEKSESGFTLRTVEMTVLCGRGVSDGLCA